METQLLQRKIKGHLLETKSQKGPSRFASEDCNTCREDISCKVPDAKLSSTRDLWYDKPGRTWPHSSPSKSSTRKPFMLFFSFYRSDVCMRCHNQSFVDFFFFDVMSTCRMQKWAPNLTFAGHPSQRLYS